MHAAGAVQSHQETEVERELRVKCEALDTEKVRALRIQNSHQSIRQLMTDWLELTVARALAHLPACPLQNGTITVEELRQSISSLGEDIGSNDLKEMVRSIDVGYASLDECGGAIGAPLS